MHISYIQTVSFAVASNIGHPLFYLFFFCIIIPLLTLVIISYHFSHNLPKCTQNKHIHFFCSSTFSIPSVWKCCNNNTTSLAPLSSCYITFIQWYLN